MRAVQFFDKGDIRVVDVPEPTCQDDEIKVLLPACQPSLTISAV